MTTVVMEEPEYDRIRRSCYNINEHCASKAAAGFCGDYEENEMFYDMMIYCAPACQSCDTFELIATCTPDEEKNVFNVNDMDTMFRRIVREMPTEDGTNFPDYVPVVHSRPDKPPKNTAGDSDYVIGPWVVTLENFLSSEECDHLIRLGNLAGYDRSSLEDEDDEEEGDEEAYRTSVNSWCAEDDCYHDSVVTDVRERIRNLTGIPLLNSEYLQMLRYTEGQFYKTHHDFTPGSNEEMPGPRLLTFFLYLNEVEEGGETRFNDLSSNDEELSIDIQSKKGMALIWPSVENDPTILEERTYHEALPVIKGVKYGVNAWLHLRQFIGDPCDYEEFEEISWHPSFR